MELNGKLDNIDRLYDELRLFFIEAAERECVPISPTYGLKRNIAIGNSVYFEIFGERIFQIKVSCEEDNEVSFDFYFGQFDGNGTNRRILTLDIYRSDVDMEGLWLARKSWLNEAVDEVSLEKLLIAMALPKT